MIIDDNDNCPVFTDTSTDIDRTQLCLDLRGDFVNSCSSKASILFLLCLVFTKLRRFKVEMKHVTNNWFAGNPVGVKDEDDGLNKQLEFFTGFNLALDLF